MLSAYLPPEVDISKDFFLSSLLANDEVLLFIIF